MQQPCSDYNDSCTNVVYQIVDVGLPISLTPTVNVEHVKIQCCGEPRLELQPTECGCRLELKVTQTIAYKIPIEYSIESCLGDVTTECKKNINIPDSPSIPRRF